MAQSDYATFVIDETNNTAYRKLLQIRQDLEKEFRTEAGSLDKYNQFERQQWLRHLNRLNSEMKKADHAMNLLVHFNCG